MPATICSDARTVYTSTTPPVPSSTQSYHTIFLDWKGTLSGAKFWWQLEAAGDPRFTAIDAALFRTLRPLLKPWMRGAVRAEEVCAEIAGEAHLSPSEVLETLEESCRSMPWGGDAVRAMIQELRQRGVRVCVATDNMDTFTRWSVPGLGLAAHFDALLSSADLHGTKGDRDVDGRSTFFQTYLETHAIHPGASVLIDDSPDTDGVVAGFGLHYVQIEPVVGLPGALRAILEGIREEGLQR